MRISRMNLHPIAVGVDLDYDQLARGRERYRKIPYRTRDDQAEMRKHLDPSWKRVLPRW